MEKLILLLIIAFSAMTLSAGGQRDASFAADSSERIPVQIVMPTGLAAISMTELIADDPEILPGYDVEYTILQSPDMLASKVISGEADMFIAPTNLGANLYGKGKDVRLAGSVVWGMLYIVTTEDLSGWDDLRGREISMLGRGLSPDIVFRYLLKANGLDPETDVDLNYVQAKTELAPAFISGRSTISIMPEPALSMVRMKKPEAVVMLDLQEEWAKVSGNSSGYPQASLYASGAFADDYPEFIEAFAALYADSLDSILADPQQAGVKAATFLDTPPAPVIAKAIPGGNLRWVPADEARKALEEYLGVLLEFAPDSVGGALPDDAFYFFKP